MARKRSDPADPKATAEPWRDNPDWANNRIMSDVRSNERRGWIFAVVWCAVCLPLLFGIEDLFRDVAQEPLKLLVLLFPAAGLFFLVRAYRQSRQYKVFGAAPLSLDPFPGSLGGHVGGRVDTGFSFEEHCVFSVKLVCVQSVSCFSLWIGV